MQKWNIHIINLHVSIDWTERLPSSDSMYRRFSKEVHLIMLSCWCRWKKFSSSAVLNVAFTRKVQHQCYLELFQSPHISREAMMESAPSIKIQATLAEQDCLTRLLRKLFKQPWRHLIKEKQNREKVRATIKNAQTYLFHHPTVLHLKSAWIWQLALALQHKIKKLPSQIH